MNLTIDDFSKNIMIKKKYLCKSHGGNNISPTISWNNVNNAKSYSIILEDPDTPHGNYIHMYIPFIDQSINRIDTINTEKINNNTYCMMKNKSNVKLLFGKNSYNNYAYDGPCAPPGTGIHRYIFTVYALDSIFKNNDFIVSSNKFEELLKDNNINILGKDRQEYRYGIITNN